MQETLLKLAQNMAERLINDNDGWEFKIYFTF